MSTILDNLTKFIKWLVYSRFQYGFQQFANIYIKFKGGTGPGQTRSLTTQERVSITPKPIMLTQPWHRSRCTKSLSSFPKKSNLCSQSWLLNSWCLWQGHVSLGLLHHPDRERGGTGRQKLCLVSNSQSLTNLLDLVLFSAPGPWGYGPYPNPKHGRRLDCVRRTAK